MKYVSGRIGTLILKEVDWDLLVELDDQGQIWSMMDPKGNPLALIKSRGVESLRRLKLRRRFEATAARAAEVQGNTKV